MRFLDQDNDKAIKEILVCLTLKEAMELKNSLEDLISCSKNNHAHIPDENLEMEMTLCIYSKEEIDSSFDDRTKKLILENS